MERGRRVFLKRGPRADQKHGRTKTRLNDIVTSDGGNVSLDNLFGFASGFGSAVTVRHGEKRWRETEGGFREGGGEGHTERYGGVRRDLCKREGTGGCAQRERSRCPLSLSSISS